MQLTGMLRGYSEQLSRAIGACDVAKKCTTGANP
jgi:hypothetical protein